VTLSGAATVDEASLADENSLDALLTHFQEPT
jgi:hypothetical protein